MNRIFITLATTANLFLAATYILGWSVRDITIPDSTGIDLSVHFLCGVASLTLAMLVHAIVLTYFMGTGRWIEETTTAYKLGTEQREHNIRLKYKTLPGMVGCILLMIIVGGFGAAADPGAAVDFPAAKTIHMTLATLALLGNIVVSVIEYGSLKENGDVIQSILETVQQMRRERGLDVESQEAAVSGQSGNAE